MKAFVLTICLSLSSYVFAQEELSIDGKWVIDSFKLNNDTEIVMGDGRDLWQFSHGIWSIYSSGKHISTADIQLVKNKIAVEKPSKYENMEVIYIHSDTYMQLRTSLLTYNLIRVE